MRVLVDYRPALRARTGVGEYMHELVRAYTPSHPAADVAVFTSSWADRPAPGTAAALRARVIDRRVPVGALNDQSINFLASVGGPMLVHLTTPRTLGVSVEGPF